MIQPAAFDSVKRRKPYQLVIFEGGAHTLMERPAERDAMVAEYFRQHLESD